MGVLTISLRSFFHHQQSLLFPTVQRVWDLEKTALLAMQRDNEEGVTLSGDGRADSPGHSAKFGSYTTLELTVNKVIDVELVQVKYLMGCYNNTAEVICIISLPF